MKHAYLILAHTDYSLLEVLVSRLDDARNDIYIHIDKKSPMPNNLFTQKAGLFFVEHRVDVRWGDYSIVDAELRLMEMASSRYCYAYYHLLSGADLPVKSQDYIHDFCFQNFGKLFIGYSNSEISEVQYRTLHWFLFPKHFRSKNLFVRVFRRLGLFMQDVFGYRRKIDVEVKKGSQWCSLTHEFVKYVLESRQWISQTFMRTFVPDEMFIQTLCWNSKFRDNLWNVIDEWDGCLRYIKWVNGELRGLDEGDFKIAKQSNKLFARKFSSKLPFVSEMQRQLY